MIVLTKEFQTESSFKFFVYNTLAFIVISVVNSYSSQTVMLLTYHKDNPNGDED